MIPTQPIEQKDFSGGFTDNIYSTDPTKCAFNDNLLVDNNRKAFQRWGSDLYDYDNPQIPDGQTRISKLFKFFDESWFFANNARELYYFDTAWNYFTGPAGNPAFGAGDDTTHISTAEWQKHFFCVDDAGGAPIKIYQDATNTWQVRTAGLPALVISDNFVTATATASLVALANDLRTQMLRHFANTGYTYAPHKTADVTAAAYVGAACTDLATCITLTGQLLQAYDIHYKDSLHGVKYHQADTGPNPTGGTLSVAVKSATVMALANTAAPADIYECADRLNDIHNKYWAHEMHLVPHAQLFDHASIGVNPPTVDQVTGVNKGPVANRSMQPLYDWSTQWKATYNAHLADGGSATKAHSPSADATYTIAVAAGTTPATFVLFLFQAHYRYYGHETDAAAGAPGFHVATEAGSHQLTADWTNANTDAFGGVSYDYDDSVRLIAALAALYNHHVQDLTAHFTTDPAFVINQGPGSDFAVANYNYALHYQYEYKVGDVTYIDAGPVYYFAADSQLSADVYPISITGIPVLANDTKTNYDTASITVRIYRTEDSGNIYYLAGSVANGTTTFTDNMPDDVLTTQERIYTTGGVVSNDPPPVSKCIHIVDDKGYYGNIVDDGESLTNRVRQSIAGDPDSCPGSFFDDLDDEVIGISSVQTIPIVFCKTCIFRLDGQFDELGRGAIRHVAVKNPGSVGLVSEASIIRIDNGILFAGTDGFYFTDGNILQKLSNDWNTTYASLISSEERAKRIQGTFDPASKRAFWCVQRSEDSEDNDSIFCLDLNYDLETPCWTTWSNDGGHLSPTAILMWGGKLLRGHSLGYLFIHDASLLTDPYVNTDVEVKSWGTKAILVDYISVASDMGSGTVRKWAGQLQARFKDGDLFMAISTINDEGNAKALAPIRRRSTIAWGDATINWGEPTLLWDFHGNTIRNRRMPAKSLRFTSKQIRFTSDYVLLKESGTIPGTATVDATAEKITLNNSTYSWLSDCEGYFICFDDDNYETQYEITERNSDTVIYVDDDDDVLVSGSKAWKIYGKPKNQYVHFLSYSVMAAPLAISNADYRFEASDL